MFQIRLKQLRDEHNLSQYDLADKLNIKQSTIAMWENGTNKPRQATLIKIAEFFNVPVDYLLGREEKPSENSNDLSNKIMELFNRLDEKHQQQVIEYTRFVLSLDDDEQN